MQRSVVLVTGMSGTGKSAVLDELSRRGHQVLDTDDPGWIVVADEPGGPERLWDLDRVERLIRGHHTGWLFVAGCVPNQRALYDLFDAVVLLSAPPEVVMARVSDRENPYGSRPQDRVKIAEDLAVYEPLLRAGADYEVVSTVPVVDVAETLERIAGVGRVDRSLS
jgi:dephospho-CoA kinase